MKLPDSVLEAFKHERDQWSGVQLREYDGNEPAYELMRYGKDGSMVVARSWKTYDEAQAQWSDVILCACLAAAFRKMAPDMTATNKRLNRDLKIANRSLDAWRQNSTMGK